MSVAFDEMVYHFDVSIPGRERWVRSVELRLEDDVTFQEGIGAYVDGREEDDVGVTRLKARHVKQTELGERNRTIVAHFNGFKSIKGRM